VDTVTISVKTIVESAALYIPIAVAIIALIKYVKAALNKQKLLIEELRKLQELVVTCLADKELNNDEIKKIMDELKSCQEIGMDTIEAYKDAYDKLMDLIGKLKLKKAKRGKEKGGCYD